MSWFASVSVFIFLYGKWFFILPLENHLLYSFTGFADNPCLSCVRSYNCLTHTNTNTHNCRVSWTRVCLRAVLQQRDGVNWWPVQWRRQTSVFLFCCDAGWTILVWLELGVYDFCCVGCIFVSGQQQGARWRAAKAWPGGWRLVSWTGLMVCVIWNEKLKPHEMQPRTSGSWVELSSVRWLSVFMGCLTRSVLAI